MLAAMPPSPAPRPPGPQPPVRDRGDACPGALRLHSAADGKLARVRLPAGDLTSHQAAALADAAERFGDGRLSLTSRGNVELRGLADDCGASLGGLLRDAGLLPSARHERIRNILASPLAGLAPHTPSDVRLWARELDALLCASTSATELSGRFLFVLDGGTGDVAGLGGDVTLVAERDADRADRGGALLRVGDDPTAVRITGAEAPRAALAAAEAFLAAARASGSGAWRVRELPAGHALTAHAVAKSLEAAGIGVHGVEPYGDPADVSRETCGPVSRETSAPGIVEGPDGRRSLSVLAPLGRLTVTQWRLLTAVASDDGSGELRLTPWRGVVLPGLPAATAATHLRALAAAGLITDPDSPWHRITACTGLPGCAKSRTDVRADAAHAIATGTTPVPAGATALPVHWSGCERRCGHPQGGAWVDVLAGPDARDGYRASVVRPRTPVPAPVPTIPKAQ
ncbi:precorrin-3B synthase [Streptomyces gilvosporeus]|uniref:Precorrin-3B synthase n=2 Tax=Streptomyces gilvosporeus TaxID=553510 RepID=A0A1V0TTL7_9ACTN|nr:precorrin-3B synthase [Streptomyces gilvosporeus]